MNPFRLKFTGGKFAGKEMRCASLVTALDLFRGAADFRKLKQDPKDSKHFLLMEGDHALPGEDTTGYHKIADIYLDE